MRVFTVRDWHGFSLGQGLNIEINRKKNQIIFGAFSVECRKTFETFSAVRLFVGDARVTSVAL